MVVDIHNLFNNNPCGALVNVLSIIAIPTSVLYAVGSVLSVISCCMAVSSLYMYITVLWFPEECMHTCSEPSGGAWEFDLIQNVVVCTCTLCCIRILVSDPASSRPPRPAHHKTLLLPGGVRKQLPAAARRGHW